MKHSHTKGFTLAELLIVIGVIVLLGALALFSLTRAQRTVRDTQVFQDMKTLQTALEFYYTENGRYPTLAEGAVWSNSDEAGLGKELSPFLEALPESPRADEGSVYTYAVSANGEQYVLQAELEQADHSALTNDVDGTLAGEGWMSMTSKNALSTGTTIDCNDESGAYCVASE